ncbi:hypothetical protein [Rhizobium terrae]|uniref:hypothetical protein n=1 Tax=Rhizobium terrae TaxID=2171756 RepID=UPI0013C31D5A|nr:hypothetical protein [Rhizobium terrae]
MAQFYETDLVNLQFEFKDKKKITLHIHFRAVLPTLEEWEHWIIRSQEEDIAVVFIIDDGRDLLEYPYWPHLRTTSMRSYSTSRRRPAPNRTLSDIVEFSVKEFALEKPADWQAQIDEADRVLANLRDKSDSWIVQQNREFRTWSEEVQEKIIASWYKR